MLKIRPSTFVSPLKKNDEVITAAISSAIDEEQSLLNGLQVFEEWGLICRPNNLIRKSWGFFAGTDDERYKELHPINSAPLITFARGGWGGARLLERKQSWRPGFLLGFSDITSILLSRLASGFYGGIHGPLVTTLEKEPDWSKERLKELLFGLKVPDLYGESWNKGIAKGPLVVANLTVLAHLIGSSHIPDLHGAILVLEDVNEEPYRIDRLLTHLRLTGLLQKLSGRKPHVLPGEGPYGDRWRSKDGLIHAWQ